MWKFATGAQVYKLARGTMLLALGFLCVASAGAVDLTLEKALSLALKETARGSIIDGQLEVAQQNYRARRTNFYFPEISINGQLPAYNQEQAYRFPQGGSTQKLLYETSDLGFRSFIEAKQSLLTGGDLTITANLTKNDEDYPVAVNLDDSTTVLVDLNEKRQEGYFEFNLTQPILKPSQAKHELNNRRDDLELAKLSRIEERTALSKEVIEAYVGVLRLNLARNLAEDKLEAARLKAEIDSAKFSDGVISEEEYLESKSAYLDAELARFEASTDAGEKIRELAMLLDIDPSEEIVTDEPAVGRHLSESDKGRLINNWEQSLAIHRARYQYNKALRESNYTASDHGLNGDLSVKYSLGRGNVETAGLADNDINTNSWGVSLNLTYPIWDGGASSSSVKAAQLEAEQARLEFMRAEKSAKAQIVNLVNRLDVSSRRLEIVRQQIELADNRLAIASSRRDDGQISELTFLESRVSYLEAKDKYLEELKNYLINKVDLEGTFAS